MELELKTVPLQDLYTTESRAAWNERHEQFLRGELAPDKVQFDIKLKNGTIRSLETSHKEVLWDGRKDLDEFKRHIRDVRSFFGGALSYRKWSMRPEDLQEASRLCRYNFPLPRPSPW